MVRDVQCGLRNTGFITYTKSRALFTFGYNNEFQLGLGHKETVFEPQEVRVPVVRVTKTKKFNTPNHDYFDDEMLAEEAGKVTPGKTYQSPSYALMRCSGACAWA